MQTGCDREIMARLVDDVQVTAPLGEKLDDEILPHQPGATGDDDLQISQRPGIGNIQWIIIILIKIMVNSWVQR